MKLAIVVTHPIRYFVPLIQQLTNRDRIQIKVFYTYGPDLLKTKKYNPENWSKAEPDLPIYEGYNFTFVYNKAKNKSTYHYKGIDNPTLISEIEQWKPDTLMVCGWKFRSHLRVIRYFKGKIPIHFRGDSGLVEEVDYTLLKKLMRRIILRWVFSHVDKCWYIGTQNELYYLKAGVSKENLIWVPDAVDNNRFKRTAESSAKALDLKYKLRIPKDAVVFLFAGRMIGRKQVSLLLSSFVEADVPNTYLLLAGAGKDLDMLQQMVKDKTNIRFLPHQTQTAMPVLYSATDVFVLPSKVDTWGLVVNEAMANGLAIIASDQCGSSYDLIEDGHNGYRFHYNDGRQLATLIKKLAADKEKLLKMGGYSIEKIHHYSYDVAIAAIENLLLKSDA